MEIFISWHGRRSHSAAEALREWLPQIVNAFRPWLSSADIDKGARWSAELAGKLESTKAGVFCLTPSNLSAPWLLFEAGAISKIVDNSRVIPLLIGVDHAEITGPLAQFQGAKTTKEEMLQLVKNLNAALDKETMQETHIEKAFQKWWPDLERQFQQLPPDEQSDQPRRSQHDLLSEAVELARQTAASIVELKKELVDQFQYRSLAERTAMLNAALEAERKRMQEEIEKLDYARKLDQQRALAAKAREVARVTATQDEKARLAAEAANAMAERVEKIAKAARESKIHVSNPPTPPSKT